MNLYNNYNINDGVTGSNIDNNNSNDKDSIEFTTVAAVTSSPRPSCSSISVMVEGGLKWKTSVVPVGATSTLPRRDFHFKRIEVEEAPKWFVWPKRNKVSKSSENDMIDAVSAVSHYIMKLANAINNRQQNLVWRHNLSRMTLLQSESNNTLTIKSDIDSATCCDRNTELTNISNSEPSSYIMRCRIATKVDSEYRISGSVPNTSQTFKILLVSKKTLESGDDDDLDLANSVILNSMVTFPPTCNTFVLTNNSC
ncbi:Uncharacterized protein BM_BM8946 [Brugia malayi]|uniref:Uncharacterized protein n=1 Tax=Brugia malayi TaxID=6279 RepID=A0A4E9FDV0_BRUMA|nr:Uncharacterized protein BM_BM8946 [Brugia malayi]VIO94394.1 Uncharacterized protein BM_BM8946 [Brugia malayi]